MSKYRVNLVTQAYQTVDVEIEDEGLHPDTARENAIDAAYNAACRVVCAHCAGAGQPWMLKLDGDWEITEGDSAVEKIG